MSLPLHRTPEARELIRLAYPLAIQSIAYTALGMVDRVMVGSLGEAAISGVGVGGQVLGFVTALAGAIAGGCSILAAQYHGARETGGLADLTGTATRLSILGGLAIGLALVAGAYPFCYWLSNSNAEVASVGRGYLVICATTMPVVLATFVLSGVMRSLGDTRTPFVVSLVSLISNTFLNWVFIFGHLGAPAMGTNGAALATAISHMLGLLAALALFRAREHDGYRFRLRDTLRYSNRLGRRTMALAGPIALDMLFWQAATLAYTKVVALAGPAALAAYMVFNGVRGLGYIPLGALGSASSVVVGRELGANRREALARSMQVSRGLTLRAALAMAGLYVALAAPYLMLFNITPEVWNLSFALIALFAFVLPFEAFNVLYSNVLRAGGDALRVSFITFSSFWLVGIPAAFIFGIGLGWGMLGCFLGLAAECAVKAWLFHRRETGGRWARRLVG